MKIEQLYYFLDLTNTLSITKTAQNYFISQQALSISLKKLEDECKKQFFKRTKYGVLLTKEGINFINTAKSIITLYEQIFEESKADNFSSIKPLKIAVHPRFSDLFLTDILPKFIKTYPSIPITYVEEENNTILDLLANHSIELGLSTIFYEVYRKFPTLIPDFSGKVASISCEILLENNSVVCLSKEMEKQINCYSEKGIPIDMPIVCYEHTMKYLDVPILNSPNRHVIISTNSELHKMLVSNSLCWEILSRLEYEKRFKRNSNVIARPVEMLSCFCCMTTDSENLSHSASIFLDFIRNEINRIR